MTSLLEQQVTIKLTSYLGRAPTAEEIRLAMIAPNPLAFLHNTNNIAENTISISPTSDDSIQDAIDKINSNGGGVVYLNPGTYTQSTDITLYSNIYLIGLVRDLCIIDFSNTAKGIVASAVTGSLVENLVVRNSSTNAIEYTGGFNIVRMNYVAVEDSTVGFSFDNGTSLNINDCGTDSCGRGIVINNVVQYAINYPIITGTTTNDGIKITATDIGEINGGSIENCGQDGIHFDDCDFSTINNVLIRASGRDGVRLNASSSGNILRGMNLLSNTGYGINIANVNNSGNIIGMNIFVSNTAGAVNDSGTGTLIRSNIGVADN